MSSSDVFTKPAQQSDEAVHIPCSMHVHAPMHDIYLISISPSQRPAVRYPSSCEDASNIIKQSDVRKFILLSSYCSFIRVVWTALVCRLGFIHSIFSLSVVKSVLSSSYVGNEEGIVHLFI